MEKRQEQKTQDFLIRGVPADVLNLLQQLAKENHRSKTQEAIVILSEGVKMRSGTVKQPKPFAWKTKISNEFIQKAIDEGRE